jgi:hypothetical protein
VEEAFQKGSAPTAACSRPETLAQLPRPRGTLDAKKVHDFPLGDVKTEAKFVVRVHAIANCDKFPRNWPLPKTASVA